MSYPKSLFMLSFSLLLSHTPQLQMVTLPLKELQAQESEEQRSRARDVAKAQLQAEKGIDRDTCNFFIHYVDDVAGNAPITSPEALENTLNTLIRSMYNALTTAITSIAAAKITSPILRQRSFIWIQDMRDMFQNLGVQSLTLNPHLPFEERTKLLVQRSIFVASCIKHISTMLKTEFKDEVVFREKPILTEKTDELMRLNKSVAQALTVLHTQAAQAAIKTLSPQQTLNKDHLTLFFELNYVHEALQLVFIDCRKETESYGVTTMMHFFRALDDSYKGYTAYMANHPDLRFILHNGVTVALGALAGYCICNKIANKHNANRNRGTPPTTWLEVAFEYGIWSAGGIAFQSIVNRLGDFGATYTAKRFMEEKNNGAAIFYETYYKHLLGRDTPENVMMEVYMPRSQKPHNPGKPILGVAESLQPFMDTLRRRLVTDQDALVTQGLAGINKFILLVGGSGSGKTVSLEEFPRCLERSVGELLGPIHVYNLPASQLVNPSFDLMYVVQNAELTGVATLLLFDEIQSTGIINPADLNSKSNKAGRAFHAQFVKVLDYLAKSRHSVFVVCATNALYQFPEDVKRRAIIIGRDSIPAPETRSKLISQSLEGTLGIILLDEHLASLTAITETLTWSQLTAVIDHFNANGDEARKAYLQDPHGSSSRLLLAFQGSIFNTVYQWKEPSPGGLHNPDIWRMAAALVVLHHNSPNTNAYASAGIFQKRNAGKVGDITHDPTTCTVGQLVLPAKLNSNAHAQVLYAGTAFDLLCQKIRTKTTHEYHFVTGERLERGEPRFPPFPPPDTKMVQQINKEVRNVCFGSHPVIDPSLMSQKEMEEIKEKVRNEAETALGEAEKIVEARLELIAYIAALFQDPLNTYQIAQQSDIREREKAAAKSDLSAAVPTAGMHTLHQNTQKSAARAA